MNSDGVIAPLRPEILAIETQQIMQVSTLAMDDPDVIAMWYGESDVKTPDFICDAAAAALKRGQTFYTHKWGIPALRETLATYTGGLYGIDVSTGRVTVTSSGMTGIMMLMQALVGGDRDNFIKTEASARKQHHMPPYGRLAAIIVSGRNERAVDDAANALGRSAPRREGMSVLGPAGGGDGCSR